MSNRDFNDKFENYLNACFCESVNAEEARKLTEKHTYLTTNIYGDIMSAALSGKNSINEDFSRLDKNVIKVITEELESRGFRVTRTNGFEVKISWEEING